MPAGPPYIRPAATCHPDRKHQARGLCASCYQTQWRKENPEKLAARTKRMATCHPDRPVMAHDLCNSCYRREWRNENREYERTYQREYQRKRNSQKTPRDRFLRVLRRYGLSFDDYSALLISQSGLCAACGLANPDLEVDHCHVRGFRHVRGLLCHNCNSALGHAKDDVERLRALIGYLLAVG